MPESHVFSGSGCVTLEGTQCSVPSGINLSFQDLSI
jgi:hypothetical protein